MSGEIWGESKLGGRNIKKYLQPRNDVPARSRNSRDKTREADPFFARLGKADDIVEETGESTRCTAGVRTREQLITVHQIVQRHRLLAQRVDHMMIIDDVTALALRYRPATPKRHHRCCAEEALDPVIVEVHAQAMADQPRWRGVEDATQDEAAARGDGDNLLLVIGRPPPGKRGERRP